MGEMAVLSVPFSGTLEDLLEVIGRVVPHASPEEGECDWHPPELLVGEPDSRVVRIVFDTGLELDPGRLDSMFDSLEEGDCLVLLESTGTQFWNPPPPVRDRVRRSVTHTEMAKWTTGFLGRIERAGAALIWLGDTWEAWEKGPASLMSEKIKERLHVESVTPIEKVLVEKAFKVVVFVPRGHEDEVRNAMARAGAGHIGNYSHCTFQAPGKGTFLPLEGSNPYIGSAGKLEITDEFRLETIVRERRLRKTIDAMLKSHPYEEVAYDIFKLENGSLVLGGALQVVLKEQVDIKELIEIFCGDMRCADLTPPGGITDNVLVCRFCGPREISAAKRTGAGVVVYLEDTYPGMVWRRRFGICGIKAGKGVYADVLRALADSIAGELSAY